jgi:hypothetical protein
MRVSSTPLLGRFAAIALSCLPAALPFLSCSSSSANQAGPPSSTDQDAAAPAAVNPDGVPYPSKGFGNTARTGNTPGNVMQNFTFQGYPDADESKGLQTISLANYYDPCRKRSKLLHVTVAGVWCVPCNQETDALVAAKAELASDGVVVIQALGDGPVEGVGATVTDLDNWVAKHMSNFTEMLDPGFANFGSFFDTAAVPWNCDIDPRTMEILRESTGWPGDLDMELQPALAALPAEPGYPVPAVCGDQ